MAEIVLKNATKKYRKGKVVAVNDLTLTCKDKGFVAILGPSGAGKTSTLKMIAGIEDLTEGSLTIGGEDMTNAAPQNRNVSMVFEGYALYPHMTVRENLAFPLKAKRYQDWTSEQIHAKVNEWAQTVGLDGLLDRKPSQLSGGQRQRVSLARALVRAPEPSVILMDEPIAHLDAKLRNSMRAELKRLHKDLGATIIYVTHDYEEAMAMADKIVVINNGELMQEGSPREIYDNPANEFVASAVGDPPINLLKGVVEEVDGKAVAKIGSECVIPLPFKPEKYGPSDIGIRPSEILISRDGDKTKDLYGTIERILPTGAKQIVEINFHNWMLLAKVKRDYSYKKGETVFLKPQDGKIYLFDSETKVRIYEDRGGKENG